MSIEYLFFIATSFANLRGCIQVISIKARDKVLSKKQKEIKSYKFKIIEDITIIFKGILCIIKDGKGKLVKELDIKDG